MAPNVTGPFEANVPPREDGAARVELDIALSETSTARSRIPGTRAAVVELEGSSTSVVVDPELGLALLRSGP